MKLILMIYRIYRISKKKGIEILLVNKDYEYQESLI